MDIFLIHNAIAIDFAIRFVSRFWFLFYYDLPGSQPTYAAFDMPPFPR
jgi:hypothetical protein